MKHIHDLWRELELPDAYPDPDLDRVKDRVRAALDAGGAKQSGMVNQKIRWIAVFAAALVLLTGTALAVASGTGLLDRYYLGDTSQLDPLIQKGGGSVSDGALTLTLEQAYVDETWAYAMFTVEALTEEAAGQLLSGDVLSDPSVRFLLGQWSDQKGSTLNRDNAQTLSQLEGTFSLGVREAEERRTETSATYLVRCSVTSLGRDASGDGGTNDTLWLCIQAMGWEYALPLPPVGSSGGVVLYPGKDLEVNPELGHWARLEEIRVGPLTQSIVLSVPDTGPNMSNWEEFIYPSFWLKMKDGTIYTAAQLGQAGMEFDPYTAPYTDPERHYIRSKSTISSNDPVSLSPVLNTGEMKSVIVGDWEFPLDGSDPFRTEAVPEELKPFLVRNPLGEYASLVPAEELFQKLGADFSFDYTTRTGTAVYRGVTLTFLPGQESTILVNGKEPASLSYSGGCFLSGDGTLYVAGCVLSEEWNLGWYKTYAEGSPFRIAP